MKNKYRRKDGATQYTFTPDPKNREWLNHASEKNRRPISVEINLLIEKARLNDETYG